MGFVHEGIDCPMSSMDTLLLLIRVSCSDMLLILDLKGLDPRSDSRASHGNSISESRLTALQTRERLPPTLDV